MKTPFVILAPQVNNLWKEMLVQRPSSASKEQLNAYAEDKSEIIRELIINAGWEIDEYVAWTFNHISPLN
jgi:hypothetical protein